jgi:hypothetical protein
VSKKRIKTPDERAAPPNRQRVRRYLAGRRLAAKDEGPKKIPQTQSERGRAAAEEAEAKAAEAIIEEAMEILGPDAQRDLVERAFIGVGIYEQRVLGNTADHPGERGEHGARNYLRQGLYGGGPSTALQKKRFKELHDLLCQIEKLAKRLPAVIVFEAKRWEEEIQREQEQKWGQRAKPAQKATDHRPTTAANAPADQATGQATDAASAGRRRRPPPKTPEEPPLHAVEREFPFDDIEYWKRVAKLASKTKLPRTVLKDPVTWYAVETAARLHLRHGIPLSAYIGIAPHAPRTAPLAKAATFHRLARLLNGSPHTNLHRHIERYLSLHPELFPG